jgi:ferrochelatase
MTKIAVVLFNLGGPDSLEAVGPFLFNLFSDPAILRVPQPLRYMIARFISIQRTPTARAIYTKLGGCSPLLKNTQDQADALEQALNKTSSDPQFKVFIAMRCWHPLTSETIQEVKEFAPDEIILLPLYPQFSTTTTQSSLDEWRCAADQAKLNISTQIISSYPQEQGFIRALAALTRQAYEEAQKHGTPRLLLSAHGLPQAIINAGDPYADQCAQTVEALRRELAIENLDSVLCFQSRVGPLKWIGPSTDDEIRRAGHDGVPVVVAPIAFVCDHAETLVELDIDYRHLAQQSGVPFFIRAPVVGTAPDFINGLAQTTRDARGQRK